MRARGRSVRVTVVFQEDLEGAPVRTERGDRLPAVEVVRGPLPDALAVASGHWILVVASDAEVDLEQVHRAVDGAPAKTDFILVGEGPARGRLDGALPVSLLAPGVLVRRALTDGFVGPAGLGAEIALRLHAARRAPRRPHVVRIATSPVPARPPKPRTGGLSPHAAAARWVDFFAQIGGIGGDDPRIGRLAAAAKDAVSVEVGRVIAAEPGIRRSVFEEVDRRGLEGFSFRRANAECARDLAIVYAFPPFLDTGGFVASRRLAGRADAFDVLTQDMSRRRARDERSMDLVHRDMGRHMVVREPLATVDWTHVERFCRTGMDKIAERERTAGLYRSVYTRSMWIAPSVLGAWYKAQHPDTPWTAELSDPIVQRPDGANRAHLHPADPILEEIRQAIAGRGFTAWTGDRFFEAVEWMVFALADRIIFTNDNQRELMLEAFPDGALRARARSVSEVQPHPVPASHLYEIAEPRVPLPEGKITIGYFGSFYGVRGVDDLLAPFAELTADELTRVRLMIFTADSAAAADAIRAHGAASFAEAHPAQPYFEFLALARRMDWLVLADAHSPAAFSRNPYLPSKLADYRGAGTPVWGIVEPGSALSAEQLDEASTLGLPGDGGAALRRIIARSTR